VRRIEVKQGENDHDHQRNANYNKRECSLKVIEMNSGFYMGCGF
jgi:hypothetical protein